MRIVLLLTVGAAIVVSACRATEPEVTTESALPSPDTPYVKIWVSKAGSVELDGEIAELAAVESALATLAKEKGVVIYGRDAPAEDPHPNGMAVIQMVIANRLPIRMSTTPDFTDAVTPDGKLKQ